MKVKELKDKIAKEPFWGFLGLGAGGGGFRGLGFGDLGV